MQPDRSFVDSRLRLDIDNPKLRGPYLRACLVQRIHVDADAAVLFRTMMFPENARSPATGKGRGAAVCVADESETQAAAESSIG